MRVTQYATPEQMIIDLLGPLQHDEHMVLYRWHRHARRFGVGFYAEKREQVSLADLILKKSTAQSGHHGE